MDGSGVTLLIVIGFFMFAVISGIAMLSCHYTLDGIKSKTVGDGQHGTAVLQRNRKSEEHLRMWNISLKRGAGEADYRKRRDWLWGESLKGKE